MQVEARDRILVDLKQAGIGAGIHYPVPLHQQPAYAYLDISPTALPVTHRTAKRLLSLPIYPEMTQTQVQIVVTALSDALAAVS